MEINKNVFKQAVNKRQLQIGLWSSMCSNISAEIVAYSGFDWILLDTEHSPNEIPGLIQQMQAMKGGTASPVIRAAWNDTVLIKRVLDAGAQSILLPYVQNAEEAKRAVDAVRYPPRGVRGVAAGSRASNFGRVDGYLTKADAEICLLLQVETRSALDQLEAIASVDGVDGVFIGPADLSASLGHLGNIQHPEAQAAIQDAAKRIAKVGKAAGILTGVEAEAKRYIDWGYNFVAVGTDTSLLRMATDNLVKTYKG